MIHGVEVVPLKFHVDDRGYLIEVLRRVDPHFKKFGQVYLVGDPLRGTIKGWHKHLKMHECFFVTHGTVKFALHDDRHSSPTYQQTDTYVLGERNAGLLVVPSGIFHGHMALTDDVQFIAVASEVYNHRRPDEVRVPYDSFGYDWQIKWR